MTPKMTQDDWAQDGDDDYSEDDDEEKEEDEDNNWWMEDVVGAWKQHLVAIFIAVGAAAVVAAYNGETSSSITSMIQYYYTGKAHGHLHTYQRTADIAFCPDVRSNKNNNNNNLHLMDFRVPQDLVSVLQHHYWADHAEDDDYNASLTQVDLVALEQEQPEYACLRKQVEQLTTTTTTSATTSSRSSFVKGWSWVYKRPSILEMYNDTTTTTTPTSSPKQKQTKRQEAHLTFTGFAAKFVNLSPKPILLHWDGRGGHEESSKLIAEIAPFEAVGTATTPGQSFYVSPIYDGQHALQRWLVTADTALVEYKDDKVVLDEANLSEQEWKQYQAQLLNLAYAKDYLIATGNIWLAAFPRPKPLHYMLLANYFGQVHKITTTHTHDGASEGELLELDAKVISVAPRVFQIDNFLSKTERQQLIQLAAADGKHPLQASTVQPGFGGGALKPQRDLQTRSSTNAWIPREVSPVVDVIYRRAADLLHMDESLFRHRSEEHVDLATHNSIAESLQLVHYDKHQQYTPHHDFVYPKMLNRYQPTRFATLLLYLNDGYEGGETTFPRAVNAEFHDGITVTPKGGRAVLFYNMLPDGNVDDLSQHGSNKVITGEKWLANLWVWDPIID